MISNTDFLGRQVLSTCCNTLVLIIILTKNTNKLNLQNLKLSICCVSLFGAKRKDSRKEGRMKNIRNHCNNDDSNMIKLSGWIKSFVVFCEMSSSPDALRVLLSGFAPMSYSTASEPTVLGQVVLAWSSRFLQPKQNILLLYCDQLHQQMFLVVSASLYTSSNL